MINKNNSKRKLLQAFGTAPLWSAPVITSLALPAHAQATPINPTPGTTNTPGTPVSCANAVFNTPGNHTYTVPAGVTSLSIEVVAASGGGGGGGGAVSTDTFSFLPALPTTATSGAGGEGSIGQTISQMVSVSAGDTFNIVVGARGEGGDGEEASLPADVAFNPGAGGAPDGADGVRSTLVGGHGGGAGGSSSVTGSGVSISAQGGSGGGGGGGALALDVLDDTQTASDGQSASAGSAGGAEACTDFAITNFCDIETGGGAGGIGFADPGNGGGVGGAGTTATGADDRTAAQPHSASTGGNGSDGVDGMVTIICNS